MSSIRTKRRICLTGTPLQNNLMEYHCMLQFVKPNLLGTKTEFANRFANPIRNGQMLDSTDYDVRLMKRRAHILHDMLSGCVHRKDYSCLRSNLVLKYEYVVYVSLTQKQRELYQNYLNEVIKSGLCGNWLNVRNSLFGDFRTFQLIAAHPYCLVMQKAEQDHKAEFLESEEEEETDSDFSCESSSSSESSVSSSKCTDKDCAESVKPVVTDKPAKPSRPSSDDGKDTNVKTDLSVPEAVTPLGAGEWFRDMVSENDANNLELSSKMFILFELIRRCESIGDKL
ncbi:unnamed protein product [Soboliphyme baturini]|uniref:SNF2_N domain-containing protein n=1 Tax=Soboliphyme baturini TaxID=241478 RepID=A0A183J849_9BILA|nr:unnamed protein product [Soboliphyme baturini]